MTRRFAVWVLGTVLLGIVVFLVGCAAYETSTIVPTKPHPQFTAGTACDAAGCHDDYTHKEPYNIGTCDLCHTTTSWKPAHYTHENAEFDQGMHPLIGCPICHTEGEPLPTGGCATCHDAPHGGWTGCSNCHTPIAWTLTKPLPDNHLSLGGGHAKLICQDCHKTAEEPAVPRTCTNCHGTNHGGLTTCQDCHTPDLGWKHPKADFNHNEFWVRAGAHARADCGQCHPNDRFVGTPRVCVGCHGKKHGGLTDCGNCHTPTGRNGFKSTTFDHDDVFPLTGQHAKQDCSRCHPNRQFARVIGGGSHRCVSCHGPQHGGLTECQDCHTTKGFEYPTFVHNDVFVLVGQHKVAYDAGRCNGCHPGGAFALVKGTTCYECHGDDSPHGSSVPTTCQTCHTPYGFDKVIKPYEDHPIPLRGQHEARACTLCHTSLDFSDPTKTCVTCHSAGSTDPAGIPHVGPTDCLSCHWPTTWPDTHFNHPPISGFGQTGVHNYTDFGGYPEGCYNCHPGPNDNPDFTGYSCTAAGCHQ